MKYTICTSYNWYQTDIEKFIIKTYYINGVAFTFDEIPSLLQDNPDIIQEANNNPTHTPEFFFLASFYLIDEECHPCLFELDLENPELLEELDNGY
jgi:hypothetical protein